MFEQNIIKALLLLVSPFFIPCNLGLSQKSKGESQKFEGDDLKLFPLSALSFAR
jgi:hypothetical protein